MRLKRRIGQYWLLLTFLVMNPIILFLPYWVKGYKFPVGWDTPWYIQNINIITNKGLYAFFEERNQILLYSALEYYMSTLFHISPITLEIFLPIVMGASLTLINYLMIKQLYNSKKLEFLILTFSVLNVNTMRLVCDLHRNLLSLIFVELSLFIVLPKYLRKLTKKRGAILILLLILGGFSQMETFFLAIVTLLFLFIYSLSVKSFDRAKHLSLVTFVSVLVIILMNSPFLSVFLSKHMTLNWTFNPQNFSALTLKIEDLRFLGGPMIPFYFIGLFLSIKKYRKKREDLLLLLFVWNVLLLLCSLLSFFGVILHSWRLVLLTTVPIMSTISLISFPKSIKIRDRNLDVAILFILILLTFIHYVYNTQANFHPWISNEAYDKLVWISTLNRTNPSIFIIYFNYGKWTSGNILLYRDWVKAILGSDTGVYFGQVNALFLGLPTPYSDKTTNQTSYRLWEHVSSLKINKSDIYLIDDWYPVADQTCLPEIYPGIYNPVKQNLIFFSGRDYYNCTKNAYGREVEWSSRMILEVYEDPFDERFSDPTYFQVSYMVPMSHRVNYTLRIRLWDCSSDFAPITIKLDGNYVTSLAYNGTLLPKIVEIPLPKVDFGFHRLSLEIIGHFNKVHMISLDYIEVVPLGEIE